MLTSKERAELRSQANTLDTTLMVGKGGITDAVIAEADNQLTTRELVKGKVLEGAMMTPREVCDELCQATGAEGIAVIGTKFVIYRFSEKLQAERNMVGRAKRKEVKVNPVRRGAQARRQAARKVREQRNEYFRQQAIDKAIEKAREAAEESGLTTRAQPKGKGGSECSGSAFTAAAFSRPISATCGGRSMPGRHWAWISFL